MSRTTGRHLHPDTTHWSLVMSPDAHDPVLAQSSLLALCHRYWYPVYAFVRRSGHEPGRAHELTRMFFQRLVAGEAPRDKARRYGRFRQFLLAELHRFLASHHGCPTGGDPLAAPDLGGMEVRLGAEGMLDESPERLLRRSFALEVLGHAHQQLRREAVQTGRLPMFEALERYLGSEPKPGELDALSQEIGAGPLSLVVAVRRLRQRFRELVDRELCETLASPTELEAERQALWQALGGESS